MKTFKRSAIAAVLGGAVAGPAYAVQIDTDGGLAISADDGSFSAELTGRVHADVDFYDSDDVQRNSGAFIRRARIGVKGNFHDWIYEVTFDNASSESDLKDAFVGRKLGPGTIYVGQFKQFQSIDEITSSNDTLFIENSYVADLVRSRSIGIGYRGTAGMVGFAGNVYSLAEASDDDDTEPKDDGVGFNGRAHVAPINEKTRALHLGVSFTFESTDKVDAQGRDAQELRGRLRPIGRDETDRFVVYDVRGERAEISRYNFEAAAIFGPLYFQGEYLMGTADPKNGGASEQDFTATYGQVSYMLTGEHRRYDFKKGRIKNPKPKSRYGAIELAGRFQYAENDEASDELTSYGFGINWYPNNNVRFMLNYEMAEVDVGGDEDEPGLLSLRGQFKF